MEAVTTSRPSERSFGLGKAATWVAILIVLAGLLHLIVAGEHMAHGVHGVLMVVAGVVEIVWGVAYWRKPSAALHGLGIVLAGGLIVLWAITRVLRSPFDHGPGEIEVLGIITKAAEGAGLAGLVAMVLLGAQSRESRWPATRALLVLLVLGVVSASVFYGVGLAAEPVLPGLVEEAEHNHDLEQVGLLSSVPAIPSNPEVSLANGAGATLPSVEELLLLLTRSGNGPQSTTVDVLYAPPIYFQVSGVEVPNVNLDRPTVVFFIAEADHDHEFGLTPELQAFLRLDEQDLIPPYEVTILREEIFHRTSQLLFSFPPATDLESLDQGEHKLSLVIPLGSLGDSIFTWELPLDLPGPIGQSDIEATQLTSDVVQQASLDQVTQFPVSALSRRLTKTQQGIEYGGKSGIKVEATYATSDYFRSALPSKAASRYLPDSFTVFALSESLHTSDLPSGPLAVSMRLDGREYQPDMAEQIVTSPHHRVTLVRFPVEPPSGLRHRVLELQLPGDERLVWHLPISYVTAGSGSGFQLTWVSMLAILGGLVAAMWPCLFQLTAFFIPALAGLSMQEAGGSVTLGRRFQVVRAAFFFVLGFTLVYTAGGALIGFAAQRLGETPNFYIWQRYAAIGGGIMIILLALRVAAKVRAPLVCKMPVLSKMAHSRRTANPLELMFAGLAFATGCMTCFGAAMVVAMVVYVGLAGSVALGAITMFLFSLGMGIPLVIAAIAMAKVLPMLFRLEKVIPWMGLASSLLMVGFAILLITGNYMVLTEWVYQAIPAVPLR